MRKDHILTPEEKLSKQRRLEENRSIRSTQSNQNIDNTNSGIIIKSPTIYTKCEPVGEKKCR